MGFNPAELKPNDVIRCASFVTAVQRSNLVGLLPSPAGFPVEIVEHPTHYWEDCTDPTRAAALYVVGFVHDDGDAVIQQSREDCYKRIYCDRLNPDGTRNDSPVDKIIFTTGGPGCVGDVEYIGTLETGGLRLPNGLLLRPKQKLAS